MSHEATNWAVKQKGLRPIAKIVLWHLADCHNPTQGCFPTQEYLADMAEVSRASVNRIMSELEHAGIIRREIRLHPETKRRISTRYRLAFEKDFEPLDVDGHVTGCDMGSDDEPCLKNDESHVSISPIPMSQSCETQTSKGTGKGTSNPPQPPENGGLGFADVWDIWPAKHRGRRDNAEGAWNALPKTEKRAAAELAETVITALTRQRKRIPALVAYLRKRIFSEYLDAPEVDTDGRFVIRPGMAEWNEWAGWARRNAGGDKGVERMVKQGYLLTKTRWPEPEADEATA